jgi:uncharacterized protein YfaS (alpha-2-macroglobulin family)
MLKHELWHMRCWILVLAAIMVFVAGRFGRAEETIQAPLQISFEPPSTAGGEVSIRFSLPMFNFEDGAGEQPEIIFEPEQHGSFNWHSATELVFTPGDEYLREGQRVTITINKAIPLAGAEFALQKLARIEFIVPAMIANKIANWPIIVGQPRFISFLNWHSEQVGRGPLFLLYDQPVEIEKVTTVLKVVNDAGNLLEHEVFRPENLAQVFDGAIDLAYVVAVRIVDLPANGQSVTLQIPNWIDPTEPELVAQSLIVNTKFQLMKSYMDPARPDGRAPLEAFWFLKFMNPYKLDEFQNALHITPEPRSMSMTQYAAWEEGDPQGASVVSIHLQLQPGTIYQMDISREFCDIFGNPLPDPISISFKSQDLPPVLQVPTGPVTVEREAGRLPLRIQNVESVEARVFRFSSPADFIAAIAAERKQSAKDYGLEAIDQKFQIPVENFEPNVIKMFDLPFAMTPGLFCVEIRAFGTGSEAEGILRDAVLIQSTDLGIISKIFENNIFVWVTRLSDAVPVKGARVTLYANGGELVSTGITYEPGVALLEAANMATGVGLGQPMLIVAENAGYTAVSRLVNDELSQPWQFNLKGKVEGAGILPAAVFTERGIYRPGETVHLKIIVGKVADIQGTEVALPIVALQIQDPRGQQLLQQPLALDKFGSADLDIPLKEEAAVGEYLVQVTMGANMTIRKFRVEEYRVPTFQVKIKSDQEAWQYNEDSRAVMRAEYLHGGTLDGRSVKWEVLRQPASFTAPNLSGYVFNLGDVNEFAGSVAAGDNKLDGQGQFAINFKPDHPSTAGPMRYTVEAAVTDVDRQTYAGRLSRVVHPTSFYVGVLPPPREVIRANETLRVPIMAVQPDGTPVEGIQVRAQLERIDYHTTARLAEGGIVQMLNRAVPVAQQQYDLSTQKVPVDCAFEFPGAGAYLVRVTAQDANHQTVQTGFMVTVSGETPTAWPRFDQDRIEVIADKTEYHVGDVAKLVVQTPYKRAQGLLTVERDGILSYRAFEIKDDTPALEVPITAEYAPNVFVSVILLRGRIHHEKDASGFETGAPGFKIGYANLKVDPAERRLAVQVTTPIAVANPGSKMTVNLGVKDQNGQTISGQATVMVVDEAVLGLTGYRTPDPVSQIYVERLLGVHTGASQLDLPHSRRARLEKIFPGGDQDRDELLFADPATLRKLFMSTAYWNPKVEVLDGKAMVEFELPDNLTTYRIMAVVTDETSRVGSGDKQIVVRKPLMIQPVLPRFVYPDDKLTVEALVFNGTGNEGNVSLAGEFKGLELFGDNALQQAMIQPGASRSFKFPVKVVGKEKAMIRFAAKVGEHTDAVEVAIPILPIGVTKKTIITSKSVVDADTISVMLPADRIPGSAHIEVVTSTTALSELKDSVQYLMGYPNGCIEQTTSTAYPLVVLADLLPEIGVEVNREDLKKFSEAGIKRILSFQTPAGGLSYWPGSPQPHAFATAFGLTALIEAKKRGYDVPDQALAGMADFLETSLRQGKITGEMPHMAMADADTRALFVMTLGRLGRPQPGYIAALWQNKDQMTAFGLSFLAIAVKEMAGDQSLLEPILAEIRKATKEEEKQAYYTGDRKGGWSFDSPLRTHGGSLIAFAEAGSGDMTGKLLTGLLSRRINGFWGNTQENVFGIMGVYEVVTRKESAAGPLMELKIEDRVIAESAMEKLSGRVRRMTLTESDLTLQPGREETRQITLKNNGNMPIFLTVRVQYDVPLTAENSAAQAQGFMISRQYETLDGQSLEGQPIPLGSLVRVRVHVRTDAKHNYVAIDDKLPAGLEPLNTSLETTEKVDMGALTNTIQRSLSVLSYKEIRDSRVAFYVDEMLAGEYEYVYVARATTPGRFLRPAGRVEAMYQPDIFGLTTIDEVIIK